MKRSYTKSLGSLHFIVLIYGFTAILGKLIEIQAIQMVWYRMIFAAISLWLFLLIKKVKVNMPVGEKLKLLGIGIIVGLHWITFFHAINISTISVTLGTLASCSLFTSILEPVFFRKKIFPIEVILGIFIILGLYVIYRYEFHYIAGIITALTSALLASIFTILNKSLSAKYQPTVISFYEMIGGIIGISVLLFSKNLVNKDLFTPSTSDIIYLLILGIICTAFAFVVSVDVMKELTAYHVMLAINMEPVYGIILAYFIFGESEQMSSGFYLGSLIILLSVFSYPIIKRKLIKAKPIA